MVMAVAVYKPVSHQLGDWMQVANAAPIPVPVHIRTPRLYSEEVFEIPAN